MLTKNNLELKYIIIKNKIIRKNSDNFAKSNEIFPEANGLFFFLYL